MKHIAKTVLYILTDSVVHWCATAHATLHRNSSVELFGLDELHISSVTEVTGDIATLARIYITRVVGSGAWHVS